MKIVAYECPDTGDIFKDAAKYRAHRRQVRAEMREDEQKKNKSEEFKAWLAEEKSKITRIAMIGPWVMANQVKLMEASNFFGTAHFGGQFDIAGDRFEKYEITNVVYHDLLSNSHNCPANGVTNFSRKVPGAPTGYVGWRGRVSGSLIRENKNNSSYPYDGLSRFIRVLTGTGGGGNKSWSYDFNIFLADWPGLVDEYNDILTAKEAARVAAEAARVEAVARQYERDKDRIIDRLNGRYYGVR